MKKIITKYPFFLLLLPIFFVWHGYVEFYDLIKPDKAVLLVLSYLAGTVAVFLFSWLLLRNLGKASLFTFSIMAINFLFGSFKDFLTTIAPGSFLQKYSFLLPALLILIIIIFLLLKRLKERPAKIIFYLNVLLFLFILIDSALLIKKIVTNQGSVIAGKEVALKTCSDCSKPDIYLILADGYSGKITLKKFFNFDNTAFENELKERGFFINDSTTSNYNYTVFSIGSLLNMGYLRTSSNVSAKSDLPLAFNAIRNNILTTYLQKENYAIYNYSIFDISEHPTPLIKTLMDFDKSPVTNQTFLSRAGNEIGFNLVTKLKLKFLLLHRKVNLFDDLLNNLKTDSLVRRTAFAKTGQPKFVYAHFVMPHWPYYFDSAGRKIPENFLKDSYLPDKERYISYLKYTNNKLLELTDYIQSADKKAIIVLLSDHGFRAIKDENYLENFQTMNLNAVFLPDSNYAGFYKGISNVNQFRVILNAQFGQHLPMLKDSVKIIDYKIFEN